jgi:hypothetical protein
MPPSKRPLEPTGRVKTFDDGSNDFENVSPTKRPRLAAEIIHEIVTAIGPDASSTDDVDPASVSRVLLKLQRWYDNDGVGAAASASAIANPESGASVDAVDHHPPVSTTPIGTQPPVDVAAAASADASIANPEPEQRWLGTYVLTMGLMGTAALAALAAMSPLSINNGGGVTPTTHPLTNIAAQSAWSPITGGKRIPSAPDPDAAVRTDGNPVDRPSEAPKYFSSHLDTTATWIEPSVKDQIDKIDSVHTLWSKDYKKARNIATIQIIVRNTQDDIFPIEEIIKLQLSGVSKNINEEERPLWFHELSYDLMSQFDKYENKEMKSNPYVQEMVKKVLDWMNEQAPGYPPTKWTVPSSSHWFFRG